MASFIPANQCLRVVLSFTDTPGHVATCRFFYTYAGNAPSNAELAALNGVIEGFAVTNLMPNIHEDWSLTQIETTDLTSETSAQAINGYSDAGGLSGGKLPASVAVVVSQETGRRYRGGHSRVYVPAGDDTKILNESNWVAAFATAIATGWGDVIAGALAHDWGFAGTRTQVMASFYDGFTNVPYGSPTKYRRVPTGRDTAAFFPVTDIVGKQTIGTQRKRIRLTPP